LDVSARVAGTTSRLTRRDDPPSPCGLRRPVSFAKASAIRRLWQSAKSVDFFRPAFGELRLLLALRHWEVQAVLLGHLDALLEVIVMVVSCGELDDLVWRAPLGDQLGELVEEVLEA
jgi:hypothetical protein